MERKRILCVDDAMMITVKMKGILEEAGFDVTTINDPFDCLAQLHTATFDLIIVDIRMPNLNGLDLIKEVRKVLKYATTPVLVVTAAFDAEAIRTGKALLVSGWLAKPFDPQSLIKAVHKALGLK